MVAERYFGRLCSPLNRFCVLCSRFRVLRSRLDSLLRSVFPLPCSAFTAWFASAVCVPTSVFCVLCHSAPRYLVHSRLILFYVLPFLLISSALCVCSPLELLLLSVFCICWFTNTLLRSAFAALTVLYCILQKCSSSAFCVRRFTSTLLRSVFADLLVFFCVLCSSLDPPKFCVLLLLFVS